MQLTNQIIKIKMLRLFKIKQIFEEGTCCKKRSNKRFDGNSNFYTRVCVECSEKCKWISRITPRTNTSLSTKTFSSTEKLTATAAAANKQYTPAPHKPKVSWATAKPFSNWFPDSKRTQFYITKKLFQTRTKKLERMSKIFNRRINSRLFTALMNLQ